MLSDNLCNDEKKKPGSVPCIFLFLQASLLLLLLWRRGLNVVIGTKYHRMYKEEHDNNQRRIRTSINQRGKLCGLSCSFRLLDVFYLDIFGKKAASLKSGLIMFCIKRFDIRIYVDLFPFVVVFYSIVSQWSWG